MEWHDKSVRNIEAGHVELDEVWGFVYCKQKALDPSTRRPAQNPPEAAGHTWTWTALDADSKLMIAWLTAPRCYDTALDLMVDLAQRMSSCRMLTSDGLYAYEGAVEDVFGADGIAFAQYVKPNTTDAPSDEQQYDRPAPKRVAVLGNPEEKRINTSYVERMNLTLRTGNRRFTRLTNAFSKKLENHKNALALFYTFYNWVRPHRSLKGATPAMAAGLAAEPYPMKWIVDLIEARAPKPKRPKHYRKRSRQAATLPTPSGISG